ncbi:hypothetical protein BDF14DRAFT_1115553 [Spinellus fusiger]|nr:hypothetical protein BDF14DRAFT_1115553 [Spinellus fusiger]
MPTRRYSLLALPVSRTYYYSTGSYSSLFERRESVQDDTLIGMAVSQCDVQQQMVFIRKVYGLVLIQTSALALMIAALFYTPIVPWLEQSHYAWWGVVGPIILLLGIGSTWLWRNYFQLSRTSQVILLGLLSVLMVLALSVFMCKLFRHRGMLFVLQLMSGVGALLVYSLQTKYTFYCPYPILAYCATVCGLSYGLCQLPMLETLEWGGPLVVACVTGVYVHLNVMSMMKHLTIEDYPLANLCLYIDVVLPLRCIHNMCELTDGIPVFSSVFYPHPQDSIQASLLRSVEPGSV